MSLLIGDAGKSRIIAFIIDNFIACLISFLIVGAIGSENGILGGTVLCLTYLSYFFVFELTWARTPGKFFQGLIIRRIDGGRCTPKQILIRTVARVLEANPILLGGIPAGIAIISSTHKQRIGDSLAGTVVVPRHATLEEESPDE
jgi:uncharacterized RDD family membrane protein YckC